MATIVIAEDDVLMADLLKEVLVEAHYDVCGTARTVARAVELCEHHKPDLAVFDLRLADGGLGTEIAARLLPPGRPGILYVTGNVNDTTLTKADGEARLGKPYRPDDVVRALGIVEQIVATGMASGSFPKGFELLEGTPASTAADPKDGKSLEIQRLRRQQAALAGFGSFALGESDLGKVLTEAARVCAEGLDVPFCKVCRYRSEENDLLVEAGVGWHEGVIGRVVSQANESSPQGRAFIGGQPVICGDLSKDPSFVLPAFYAEHGIISTVDVVIKKKEGQPYGVLEIDNPIQHDYDDHDINFLTGFANVLAEAVNTSKRNAALQGTVNRMEEMVSDRDRLLAAKNIVLSEKNELLQREQRLLEEKGVLAQELQHRVRNNLHLVHGMLSKQLRITEDQAGVDGIGAIARRVMTLAQVYDHLLGTGLSRTIDFGSYLSALCRSFQSLESTLRPDVELTCHSDTLIPLDLDSVTALGLVVSELIANSYAHAFPDGKGTINVTLVRETPEAGATLTFRDNGVGFVSSGKSARHGLGLVRRLMEQVDGSATLQSDHGTEWIVQFPVPPNAIG
jgi:two-component sensor histidine kinase